MGWSGGDWVTLGCNGGLVVLGWCWGGSPLLFSSLHFSSTNGLLWPLGKRGSLTSEREKNNILLSYKVAIIICIYMVTVAILKMNNTIEQLMWVNFEQKCVK